MRWRQVAFTVFLILLSGSSPPTRSATGGHEAITSDTLREWLTYLASDELQGRATYSAGLGLAAGYIQSHLGAWGVRAAGDNGGYLQTVEVRRVRPTSRSRVTVTVGGNARTFEDGNGITFPPNSGGNQVLTIDRVEFVGYGLELPAVAHSDFRDRDLAGSAVLWLGADGPQTVDPGVYRRVLDGRNRHITEERQAAAVLAPSTRASSNDTDDGRDGSAREFTTVQPLDHPRPPEIAASDDFFRFVFSRSGTTYDELKRRAEARELLPSFRLDEVTLTVRVDQTYDVIRTERTHNVVGVVVGSDSVLRDTFVAFGAHYDHVGYAETEVNESGRRPRAPGRITDGALGDRIWNGADDDGSGTVALMALARAFAEGPRPKRSMLFVWHAGEERGLWGSRYFADHPTVPLDAIIAHLNADMIGRNRDDNPSEANTVYLVGSDRISSELHDLSRAANAALPLPLTLNYEMNDPSDPEQIYYRSDHYSYAAKGIPVIFFTTGLHRDYHSNTDHVAKIEFGKLTRITQLLYETGSRLGNLDHAPVRDRQGPRAGKGPAQ